ncbi:MAG: translation elongation factor 4, partial [Candidatus Geothermincolia bacterium]
VEEEGIFTPDMSATPELVAGQVGYVITGIKRVDQVKTGETLTDHRNPADTPLIGYKEPKAMVFAGLYPVDSAAYEDLRNALDKLRLNDAAFTFEPETSKAMGFGFRCGFLGLLHMEIVRERLEREYGLSLVSTAPTVVYEVVLTSGEIIQVRSASELPEPTRVREVREPYILATVLVPSEYLGGIMDLCTERRGIFLDMTYLTPARVELRYRLPLQELVLDFYDQLKSRSRGYASLDYEHHGFAKGELVKLDILINAEPVDAFSTIVTRASAYSYGKQMVTKLRELIPRQLFDVPLQAVVGGRVIARETIKAKRKDVLAKCYGGDVSRKRKLLEKQKEGKKRMKMVGRVEIPQEAFFSAVRIREDERR